jgi:hypothetical protein
MQGQVLWLTPVIPTITEAEIGRIAVQGQPDQKHKIISENQLKRKGLGVCV